MELRDRFWSASGQTDRQTDREDFRAGPAPGGPGRRLGPGTLPAHPRALPGPGAKSIPFMGTPPFTPIFTEINFHRNACISGSPQCAHPDAWTLAHGTAKYLIKHAKYLQPAVVDIPFKNLVKINIFMGKCAKRWGPLPLQSGPAPGAGVL